MRQVEIKNTSSLPVTMRSPDGDTTIVQSKVRVRVDEKFLDSYDKSKIRITDKEYLKEMSVKKAANTKPNSVSSSNEVITTGVENSSKQQSSVKPLRK